MSTTTEPKKRGPRTRLPEQQKFSTTLPSKHRKILDDYAEQENISVAEALRRAIDLLPKRES